VYIECRKKMVYRKELDKNGVSMFSSKIIAQD